MSGPGGPDIYTLPSGQPVAAFAAWQGTTIGYLSCGIRPMYLADLTFDTGSAPPTPSLTPDPAGGTSPAASPACPGPPPVPPGYWQVGSDGGVFTFGAAGFYGSTGSMRLNQPVVGLAPTPDHRGYWLVASDGGVFAYGDAGFYGSTGSMVLNKPIIGMIATLDGRGYWLIAGDGGVFAFGDATLLRIGRQRQSRLSRHGRRTFVPRRRLLDGRRQRPGPALRQRRVRGPTSLRTRWLPHHRDGGVAAVRTGTGWPAPTATWPASATRRPTGPCTAGRSTRPSSGSPPRSTARGYWLQGSDGGIFTFGDAPFLGSMGGLPLNAPMVGIAST